jgi:hypothetical protein
MGTLLSARISHTNFRRQIWLSVNMFQKYRLMSQTSFNYFYVIQICCDLHRSCGRKVLLDPAHVAPHQNGDPALLLLYGHSYTCISVCIYRPMYECVHIYSYMNLCACMYSYIYTLRMIIPGVQSAG